MTRSDWRIGMVGLGALGLPMAVNLQRAGYALQAANQQQHNWQATDKSKEQAVYQQIKNSIDAKRPDRPDADYCENPAPALRPKRCAQCA